MSDLAKRVMEGDVFDCPICLDTLNIPKYLPCLHNFCENCLDTYIKDSGTQIPGTKSSYFKCPVCRAMVIPPDPRSSIETWASQMPGNNLIVALLEDAAIAEEHFCDPCKKGDETIVARVWCQDCSEFLCDRCHTDHARTRGTNRHKVLSAEVVKSTATSGVEVPEPCMIHDGRNLEVYCLKHKKMACIICLAEEHRHCTHIRSLELMAAHMNATGGASSLNRQLTSILQKSESFIAYKELYLSNLDDKHKEMHDNMEKLVQKAKSRLDFLHEQFKHELDESQEMIKSKLNVKKERIMRFKKTLENNLKILQLVAKRGSPKQLFIQTDKIKKQITRQLEQIEEYFGDDEEIEFNVKITDTFDEFATSVKSLGTVNVVFKSKNAKKSRMEGLDNGDNGSIPGRLSNSMNRDPEKNNYMSFRAETSTVGNRRSVGTRGQSVEFTADGVPNFNRSRSGSRMSGGAGTRNSGNAASTGVVVRSYSPDPKMTDSSNEGNVSGNVNGSNEKRGVNAPMDDVPEMDEDLWDTDNLFNSISALDINMDSISEQQHLMKLKEIESMNEGKELNSWFTGGSFLNDGRVILADHNNNCLKVFNQFAVAEGSHKFDDAPWDVASGHSDDLFVTFCNRKFIKKFRFRENAFHPAGYVRTTKGNWGIDVCQDYLVTGREGSIDILNYQGRLLRSILRGGQNVYVCGSRKHKLIYYTDCDDIVCRAIFAKSEKFRYRNDEIKGARGIAVDNSDDIYVCGIYSHNVFKVSSDGSKGKVVIPDLDNIREPFALGIDHVGEKVFATSYNESTAVTFFQLSKSWTL